MKHGYGEQKEYTPPERKSTLGGSVMDDGDSAGVASGVSMLHDLETESGVVKSSPNTQRVTENPVKGKASQHGVSFDIC